VERWRRRHGCERPHANAGSHGSVRHAEPDHGGGQGLRCVFVCIYVCVCVCARVCVCVGGIMARTLTVQIPTDLSDTPNPPLSNARFLMYGSQSIFAAWGQ
jgi:hypothetical protein